MKIDSKNISVPKLLVACFLLFALIAASSAKADPGDLDTLRIGEVSVTSSPAHDVAFTVPVRLINDQEICAGTYGLSLSSSVLSIDSVSWNRSSINHISIKSFISDVDDASLLIGFVKGEGEAGLVSGDSILADIWFTLPAETDTATIVIDSSFVEPAGEFISVTCELTEFIPQFEQGIIVIQNFICGDVNASTFVDIDDVVYLIQYLFAGGPEPEPVESGEVDCSEPIDIDDIVYLIVYLFQGGVAPCDPDGNGIPDC